MRKNILTKREINQLKQLSLKDTITRAELRFILECCWKWHDIEPEYDLWPLGFVTLFDHRPLTKEEIEYGQKLWEQICQEKKENEK
jgi:hypothetical protein